MKRKRKAGWAKDLLAILLFLLLLPYFAISFKQQNEEWVQTKTQEEFGNLSELIHNRTYFVIWEEEAVSMKLPVEHFLIGALAASIPISYEEEVLKAQVVVLRSTLCEAFMKSPDQKVICLNEESGHFWNDYKMQTMWGENYEKNLERCVKAVLETQGMYMTYENKPVNGCYHGMSAGKTRNPSELSQESDFAFLKEAECTDNISALDYIREKKISKEEVGELQEGERTKQGYVLSIMCDGKMISGEQLREQLELASSNFTWLEKGEYYIFTTKGVGHGFGLDQYYANILAQKGVDYKEILKYFFADIVFQKME